MVVLDGSLLVRERFDKILKIVEPIPLWSINIVFSNWFPLVMRSEWELFKPCLPALYLKLIWCSAHVSLLCSDTRVPGEGWRRHTTGQSVSSLWLTPEIIASQELLMTPSHTVTRDCPSLHFTNTTTVLIGLFHHQLCQLSDNQNDSLLLCN